MRKLLNEELDRLTPEQYRQSPKLPVVVVLDNIRSMHNIGSVFRTCDAFRIGEICLCGITAKPPHKEIHKTALGATETVEWTYYDDTLKAVRELKHRGYIICSVEQTEESLLLQEMKIDLDRRYALVFGHEMRGVDQAVIDSSDQFLEIPQIGTKHSLNVSVSVGIVLWEFFRALGNQLAAL